MVLVCLCDLEGRYWQVADGPSSSLSIGTDSVALGSYNMELVIYHCRGKDKFVPLGYASTVFTVTGLEHAQRTMYKFSHYDI